MHGVQKVFENKRWKHKRAHRHLEKKHSQDYVEYSEKTDGSLLPPPKKKQQTMVEMLETKSKYDNSIQKQFDSAMLDYFCTDLASLHLLLTFGLLELRTATSLGLFMLLAKIGDYITGLPMSNNSQAGTQVS